ncbi:9827_t:CDS:2 [Funneliformis geosporum]|nr:9827_t:CDS:2 [Funneliformis geosporum]
MTITYSDLLITNRRSDNESEQATLRQHPYRQEKGIKLIKLLQIQEDAYSLFSKFAYRLFSIPPNSATSERQLFAKKTQDSLDSLKVYNELNNTDDDDISNGDKINIDEMIDDLEQISARIINDINVFDSNNDDNLQPPTLLELFDS